MIQKKWENLLKKLLPINRYLHRKICSGTGLSLDYTTNREAVEILMSIFIHREYADFFPMQQEATVIDVGAHFGYFSFFAALNLKSESRIFALEPSKTNFAKLEKNLATNSFSNIQAFPLGLDGQSGERTFYGGPSFNHSFFSNYKKNPHTITTLSLKNFLQEQQLTQVDFLKLDCEGAEFPILLQADKEDLEKVNTISLEFHDLPAEGYHSMQLIQHLRQHGFEIVKYQHDTDYSFGNLNFGKIIATRFS